MRYAVDFKSPASANSATGPDAIPLHLTVLSPGNIASSRRFRPSTRRTYAYPRVPESRLIRPFGLPLWVTVLNGTHGLSEKRRSVQGVNMLAVYPPLPPATSPENAAPPTTVGTGGGIPRLATGCATNGTANSDASMAAAMIVLPEIPTFIIAASGVAITSSPFCWA